MARRDWLTDLPYVTRQSWPHGGFDFWSAGRQNTDLRVVVNHSTETIGFPGYRGGADAPHLTCSLATGLARQHIPLSYGARALAVNTREDYREVWHSDRTVNITGVVQIEWVGAVTPGYPSKYGHYDIPNIGGDEAALGYVARLWADLHDATGIPLQLSSYAVWARYPDSYGVTNRNRLSSAQYRDARGMVGHQHVPANNHGDGLLGRAVKGRAVDMEVALKMARALVAGDATPLPVPPPVRPAPDPYKGFELAHLRYVEGLLDALGYDGRDVWAKTLAYQTAKNLTPLDGLPGPQTTKSLEEHMDNLEKQIARLAAAVEAVPRAVWDADVPFHEGTSLHNTFGDAWRAGALVGIAARAALVERIDTDAVAAAIKAAGAAATAEEVVDALVARLAREPEPEVEA